ncbi:Immunoglobulin superfamily DCC subclass member 4 [Liparis tanakae]|nr:Immunoglobulin superfamily DCC subclass member 4 [Liparis tanakae]
MQNGMQNGIHNGMQNVMQNVMHNVMPNGMPNGMHNWMHNVMQNEMHNVTQNGMRNEMHNVMHNGMHNVMQMHTVMHIVTQNGMHNVMHNVTQNGMHNGMHNVMQMHNLYCLYMTLCYISSRNMSIPCFIVFYSKSFALWALSHNREFLMDPEVIFSRCRTKPVSVELSCGAGPSHVVLDSGSPLLLDCSLGASDAPFNITWLRDGRPLPSGGRDFLQRLANGSLLLLPTSGAGRRLRGVEGGYACVSASALGALTSRTVNVLLAGLSKFHQEPSPQTAPAGGVARFQCQIEGVPAPAISWEKDSVAVPEESRFVSLLNGVLQILEVTQEDEGAYRCVASNSARRDVSREARLAVSTGKGLPLCIVGIEAPPGAAAVLTHQCEFED